MREVSGCPSKLELQQLLTGECTQANAESLEQHVEECESCQELLQTLDAPNVLVQAARATTVGPAATPPQELVRLMAHLARMSPQRFGSEDTLLGEPTGRDTDLNVSALLAPPQGSDEMGRLGAYRILGVLGQGGMGIVFRAEDMKLGRLVALKVINPRLASNALARNRFLREARSAAAVDHDHIVPLYHVGEERGVPFLAFPLLKGETVEDRLKRQKKLSLSEVVRIGRETAEALAAAHARGLIHRDIKPANIWLEDKPGEPGPSMTGGRVKILDFGLAGAITEAHESVVGSAVAASSASLTQTGSVFGTPGYMSPEQARGAKVDGRADLFSLGVVLYRMATGQMPFVGSDVTAVLASLTRDEPAPPRTLNPRVPARLSRLILLLLAKDPTQRPASAEAVIETLDSLQVAGRQRWGVVAAGLLAVLILAGALWSLRGDQSIAPAEKVNEIHRIEIDSPVRSVAYSPDGKQVLCGTDNGLRLVDLQRAQVVRSMEWPSDSVNGVAFSPDGRRALSASMDGTARLWDLDGGQELRRYQALERGVVAVAFSRDGSRFLTGGLDGTMRLWDTDSGAELKCFDINRPAGQIWSVGFSPNGRHAFSSDDTDTGLRLWDVDSGKVIADLRGRSPRGVGFGAISPDGRLAVSSGYWDPTVRVWDLDRCMEVRSFQGHAGAQQAVFSPDGRRVLSASSIDKTVRLWDILSGRELARFQHNGPVRGVAFSPDGRYAVSGGADDCTVRVWRLPEPAPATAGGLPELEPLPEAKGDGLVGGRVVATLPGFIWRVRFSPDGQRIYASGSDGSVAGWETKSGRLLFTGKHLAQVPALALSRDGTLLFSGGTEGTAQCWDAANGNLVRTLNHGDQCWDMATSPIDDLAAVSGGNLRLWNYRTNEVLAQWPTKAGAQAFLPDGHAFFLSDIHELRLQPTNAEQKPRVFGSSLGWVRRVVVSADGRHAVSGHGNAGNGPAQLTDDYSIRLWDVKEGRLLARSGGFMHSIWGLAFTPDGRWLFAVSLDGSIHLYEVAGLKEIWRMEHLAGLYDIDVSRDGQFALTGDSHGQVRLWRIREPE